jgi:type VI secretion system protein ImpC
MPRTSSLASVQIDVGEKPEQIQPVDDDTPFRILVAGNFSGGAGRVRKPIEIDRDNFDQVLAVIAPELRMAFGGQPVSIKFRELDDFHPDSLFERLAPFQALREMRRNLSDSATFAATAARFAPAPPQAKSAGAAAPAPEAQPARNVSGADLLSEMMGESGTPAAPARAPEKSAWDQMLHDMVAPYAEPKPDVRQPEWVARTDATITGEMRALLHSHAFQELESAWRGLYFLVRRLETDENLKIFVWDMPQRELVTAEGQALLKKITVDETVGTLGGVPWAVIAGLYWFGQDDEAALMQIGAIARRARAPFLSGVAPEIVGLNKVFQTLRSSSDAQFVGLALPRFLLRLPYGEKTDSTERFHFEEMPDPPEHERYLWGNPSVACAYLLGEAFTRSGWRMRPGEVSEISGLPAHVFKAHGETELKPCAEVLLTEEAAVLLLDEGFMPLASIKGADRVRLIRFQSFAKPATALTGPWS